MRKELFRYTPFSIKQIKVLTWWIKDKSAVADADGIITDGSVRAGKTLIMSLSYIIWAMATMNYTKFGMAGKTIGSLRRNVLFTLKILLRLRHYKVKEHRTDNYITVRKKIDGIMKENYFYLFGGKDERSQDLVQGFTSGGFFFDEVALMPESFVNQAVARCSEEGRKLWFNCNPEGPYHWFYIEWIKKRKQKNLYRLHFELDDNPSLSIETKDFLKRMFIGVFYKRFIQGLWVVAQGIVFDTFKDSNIKSLPFKKNEADRLLISIDYGIQNPCTFGKYGVKQDHYHLFESYYYNGRLKGIQKTDSNYIDDLIEFIGKDIVKYITIDPSATSLIAEIRARKYFKDNNIKVVKARNSVMKGIQAMSIKLQQELFTIEPDCIDDIKEFHSYVWDDKAGERGIDQPCKENDHCMDRNRYAIYTDMKIYHKRISISGKGAMN